MKYPRIFSFNSLLFGLGLLVAGLFVISWGVDSARAQIDQQIHTRHLDVWYGTATKGDGSTLNVLQPTDHVSQNLADQIQATYGDARVTGGIQDWVSTSNDMEWVLAAAENLPAEQNLRAALAAFLAGCEGTVTFEGPL